MTTISIDEIKQKYHVPGYVHFDRRIPLVTAYEYANNKDKVISHAFFPFIHYEKRQRKFNGKEKTIKVRDICYPAHIDSVIYQHYSYILNAAYNQYVKANGIDSCVLAYRTNKRGRCNIHFAKEAIDFIKLQEEAYIVVGDFKDFFPLIDHAHLKTNLCKLLGCKNLPEDLYAIFKNVTKFSYVELEQLLKLYGLPNTDIGIRDFNSKKSILDDYSIKELKSLLPGIIEKNRSGRSIPQGSPISGVLANIYMLDFDFIINTLVSQFNGIYRRYSDDFIVIIPVINTEDFFTLLSVIKGCVKATPGLILEPKKTQIYHYKVSSIAFLDQNKCWQEGKRLSYLGFSFDGKNVYIRDKTVTKYYYRMIRKVKGVLNINKAFNTMISGHVLYERYSNHHNSKQSDDSLNKSKHNFIDYVAKATRIFGKDEKVNLVLNRHMAHIRKHLKR